MLWEGSHRGEPGVWAPCVGASECQEDVVSRVSLRICLVCNFLRLRSAPTPQYGHLILELGKFRNLKRRHVRVKMYFSPVPESGLEAGM